jgi:hypothetical protein
MAIQSYMDTLLGLREGAAICDASEQLTELIKAVRETGKAGSLTITLKVRPASKGKTQVVMIDDTITEKIPKYDREATMFYASDENLLSKNDPRQLPLEGLKVVEQKRAVELKEVI